MRTKRIGSHNEPEVYQFLSGYKIGRWLPQYMGVVNIEGSMFMMMEDINSGYESPCLIDIKLGTRHHDFTLSDHRKKKLIERARGTTVESLGLLVMDMKIRSEGKIKWVMTRHDGLNLFRYQFMVVLMEFLPREKRREALDAVFRFEEDYLDFKRRFPDSRMFSSSIIMCYDGDHTDAPMRVRLIDMVHFHKDIKEIGEDPTNRDTNDGVEFGLKNLCSILRRITEPSCCSVS